MSRLPNSVAHRFRDALGAFATGVTIVTTRADDGTDVGLTANSFNSVSLAPPMVLWSLARQARSLPAFLANPHFAVYDPDVKVALTDQGRAVVIKLVAAAKAVESHAERNLGDGETQLLKRALRKIIRDAPIAERRRRPRKRGMPNET